MHELSKQGNIPEILRIEEAIKQMPQADFPLEHFFIPGVYVRSMFLPKGSILTGKIHNYASIAILAQGTIRIADGDKAYCITAPKIMVDKPGVKRLGYAETDVTFITVHKSWTDNVSALEEDLVSDTFEEYDKRRLLLE